MWAQLAVFGFLVLGGILFTRSFLYAWSSHIDPGVFRTFSVSFDVGDTILVVVAAGALSKFHGRIGEALAFLSNLKLGEMSILQAGVIVMGALLLYRAFGSLGAILGDGAGLLLGPLARKLFFRQPHGEAIAPASAE